MAQIIALNDRAWPALTATVLTALTVMSLMPHPGLPSGVPGILANDKLQHFLAYAALALPVALARPRRWRWILALFFLWGVAIELVQPQFDRYRDVGDIVANGLGLTAGMAAAGVMRWLAARGGEPASRTRPAGVTPPRRDPSRPPRRPGHPAP